MAGAVVDFSVFALLIYRLDVGYLWAGVAGFACATLANYLVSIRLVFQSGTRFSRLHELAMVYAVSATGLVWHQMILYVCVESHGIHVMLAKVIAVGAVFFWNYFLRRNFVFADPAGKGSGSVESQGQ
jgi:putative flippase GtrA